MTDSGTVVVVIFVVVFVIFVVVFVSHDNDGDDDDDKARQAVLLVELPNGLLEKSRAPYPHSARRLLRPECTVVVVVMMLLRGTEEADVVPAMKSRVEEEPSPRREEQQEVVEPDVACCGRPVRALLPATPPLTPWDAIRQSIASS